MPEIQRRVLLHVLARTRIIDDVPRDAVASGAKQVVIFAGYDSRACRLQNLRRNSTVFELDFPTTQEYLGTRLRL